MRVLVCGGRDFRDRVLMDQSLDPYRNNTGLFSRKHTIIHGGAKGADALAAEWADLFAVQAECFPADWDQHGRAAGPLRNARMIAEGRPDLVLAFPGGRGTADMVRKAKAAGIEVREVPSPSPAVPASREGEV